MLDQQGEVVVKFLCLCGSICIIVMKLTEIHGRTQTSCLYIIGTILYTVLHLTVFTEQYTCIVLMFARCTYVLHMTRIRVLLLHILAPLSHN